MTKGLKTGLFQLTGSGAFTVYNYVKQNGERRLTPLIQRSCQANGRGGDGTFQYISGVRLDENGDMWICDAQGKNIQVRRIEEPG